MIFRPKGKLNAMAAVLAATLAAGACIAFVIAMTPDQRAVHATACGQKPDARESPQWGVIAETMLGPDFVPVQIGGSTAQCEGSGRPRGTLSVRPRE